MKKISVGAGLLFVLFYAKCALAICPICTFAVGAGIGLAEWFGVDDTITGLWVGGLIVSLIIWTLTWLKKKNINLMWAAPVTIVGYYVLIRLSLHKFIGHELNKLWGFDKLLLGITIGSLVFFVMNAWYLSMKKRHGGHAYFPLQKVVMPIAPLILLSIIFYFVTK
jgi:hypothetical protein